MNVTRNGKIARLPRAVRQELNRRLHEGEQGKRLVMWMNALPEVQAIVVAEFGGKPIREQSLSEWRKGGYRDWVLQQEALELAGRLGEDAAELSEDGRPPLTDTLALWVAARYAVATRRVAEAEGAEGWRLLRELCGDLVELRRGDHSAQRLRMERERLDFDREREREKTEAEFEAWAMENRERICQGFKTNAEKIALLRKMMFGDVDELERSGEVQEALKQAERTKQAPCECGDPVAECSPIPPSGAHDGAGDQGQSR
ncbi:MAG: hypothetical protein K8R23_06715 [Chthoniobacter sp.]|nr:hypothetical protein [Chthoniobacter sp.]